MTPDMPNARFIAISIFIVLATAWILLSYARRCYCDGCPNGWAIWLRGERQLCRECKNIEDRHARRFRPNRSIFRWIWRRAA